MVNYRIDENITYIHDGLYGIDYTYYNFMDTPEYLHFWDKNQTPLRNYYYLIDNRDVIK